MSGLPVDEKSGSILHQIPYLDKIVHAGIFAVFGVLWLRALPGPKPRFLWVGLAGVALAALTEIVQNVPIIHREGEVQDAVADVVGMLAGFPVFVWLDKILKRWSHQPVNSDSSLGDSSS